MTAISSKEEFTFEELINEEITYEELTNDELYHKHQDLVYFTLKKLNINMTSPNYDDLKQEGMMSLYKAIERFDKSLGFKFSTFAFPYIRGAILTEINRSKNILHVPINLVTQEREVMRLLETNTPEEVSKLLKITMDTIKNIQDINAPDFCSSLDFLMQNTEGESSYLKDILGEEDESFQDTEIEEMLKDIQDVVGDRDFEILKMHISKESQKSISESFGYSQSYISRLIENMKPKIKEMLYNKYNYTDIIT